VLNERHLRRLVQDYVNYHSRDRTRDPLNKDTPNRRPVENRPSPTAKIISDARVGGCFIIVIAGARLRSVPTLVLHCLRPRHRAPVRDVQAAVNLMASRGRQRYSCSAFLLASSGAWSTGPASAVTPYPLYRQDRLGFGHTQRGSADHLRGMSRRACAWSNPMTFYDAKCTTCHSQQANSPAKMSRVSAYDCVSCHVPKYEIPGSHHRFTDHEIRIARPPVLTRTEALMER
jgi:hypothetical protein